MENLFRKIFKKYGIEKAVLVGSRAKGEAKKNSDYDIILMGEVADLCGLKKEIDEKIPYNVDLLLEDNINIEVLKEMLIGSRILYKRIEDKGLEQLYHKFLNFENAFKRYESAVLTLETAEEDLMDLVRDATIKRYEFTYEMYYKTINSLLKYNGIKVMGSRDAFRKLSEFFQDVIDLEISMDMVNSRNNTSHSYSLEMSKIEFKKITEIYYDEISLGYKFLKKYVDQEISLVESV